MAESQAGKSAIAWDHPQAVGSIGVTGSSAANTLAREADLILARRHATAGLHHRQPGAAARCRQAGPAQHHAFDSGKHGAVPLVGDARRTLEDLTAALGDHAASAGMAGTHAARWCAEWNATVDHVTAASNVELPTDAQVVGAVNRAAGDDGVVVCAAGGLPGELHKLWRAKKPNGYHMEYGFSCMGYEIAGGLGVKMALPEREVFVMVGDGSYMMLNSELQTSVMLGQKLIVTVLDNRGYGCINRLQARLRRRQLQQPDPRRRPPGRRQLDRLRRPCPQHGCAGREGRPASAIWSWRWNAPRRRTGPTSS